MNGLILIKKSTTVAISALAMVLVLSILLGMVTHQLSYADSTSSNSTQTSSSTFTTSSIIITFDLPTAAVVTFVLVLLGLTAGLLLMMRQGQEDHSEM
jgi:hypothetical protein